MRVAVIGRGDVSVVHLAAIKKLGVTLAGVATHDYRELLDETKPDVVHICTPHDQHVPIALDALARGIHVLLEKPVAHTVEEASQLVAASQNLKIGVCLQNRYNATSQAARNVLRDLGAVTGASATVMWHRDAAYYQAKPWRGQKARSGGGVLINQAIHTLDLLQWLLGEASFRDGQIGRLGGLPGDVEDTATMVLDHAGGARSVFFATVTNATDAPVTIEITAGRGTLLIRGDLTITYRDGRTETVPELRPDGGGRSYWGASHELLIADFYRSLADPEPFWIGPREALKAQQLIDQIYRK
ncbi:Gfo/Idh/MocA family oxidoreductase [Actinoplanes sp. NPDC026619]|uniref:Gfo/Idh/MocA family protein n=1 Tax=Actinoplanes sp. NPDC026619 TaxID=3155798 RepID=UPI0034090B73